MIMKNKESKEIQYQKIWDVFDTSTLPIGVSCLLAVISDPSIWLEDLSIGIPCIIYGTAKIISWNKYYDHRISLLKYTIILLAGTFIASTFFFLTPFAYIQEKVKLYILSAITMILLIIIFVKKRNQLYDMRQ